MKLILKLHVDVLVEGHIGRHNDELIVSSEATTALVLEVYGVALQVFEKGGMGHTALELELVPTDEGIDSVSVAGEPVGDVHMIDGVITL